MRQGIMVIGGSMSGKSTLLQIVYQVRQITGTVQLFKINPKSISSDLLFGYFDPITKIWNDGVVSVNIRNYSNNETANQKFWIVFDGPIDNQWVENLHTALDENKKICLASGEVIRLG